MTREEFINVKMGTIIENPKLGILRRTVSQFTTPSEIKDTNSIWTRDVFQEDLDMGMDVGVTDHDQWIIINSFDDLTDQKTINHMLNSRIFELEARLNRV